MLVEFAGLPGTGKTTIVQEVALQLGARKGIMKPVSFRDALMPPIQLLGIARWLPTLLRCGCNHRSSLRLARIRMQQERFALNGTGLVEEGITHHLWRELFIAKKDATRACEQFLGTPYPLLVLTADNEERHRRIAGKVNPGPINATLAKVGPGSSEWERGRALFAELLFTASRARKVVTVETDGSIEKAVARVERELRNLDSSSHA